MNFEQFLSSRAQPKVIGVITESLGAVLSVSDHRGVESLNLRRPLYSNLTFYQKTEQETCG